MKAIGWSTTTRSRRAGLHFHLMVAPVVPSDDGESFDHRAVNTGLQMKNGETLPFWHVMFAKLDIDATPLEAR